LKGNYIDLARYLDRVQKGCRVRTVSFTHIQFLINRVKRGEPYAAYDGGKIDPSSCYQGQTTLVIVAKNSQAEIVIGIQRCKAISGLPWGIHEPTDLNRGIWEFVSRNNLDLKEWVTYWGPEQRFVLESTGLQV